MKKCPLIQFGVQWRIPSLDCPKKSEMNKAFPILLLFIFYMASASSYGQRGHGSLYSTYGLGLPSYDNFGMAGRIGGTGAAVRSPYFLNSVNPASQSSIQTGYTFMVDVDASYNYQQVKTSSGSIANNFSNLNYFSFWFRPSQFLSVSIGLTPMYTKDYSFSDRVYFEGLSEEYDRVFRGWGNLNKAYMNFSTQISPKFSVGVRPYFLFGNNTEEATFLNVYEDGFVSKKQTSLTGVGADLGFQYMFFRNENSALIFGATGNINSEVKGKLNGDIYTYIDDELLYEAEESTDTYELGPSLRGGLALHTKSWVWAADFLYALKAPKVTQSVDNQVYSFGAEYMPDYFSPEFLKRVNYSFGASYQTGSLSVEGLKIPIYSVGAAVGVPLNASSRVSLGYKYKTTGTQSTISQESLHTITLNFTFADRWFQRYNFD